MGQLAFELFTRMMTGAHVNCNYNNMTSCSSYIRTYNPALLVPMRTKIQPRMISSTTSLHCHLHVRQIMQEFGLLL